MSMRSRLLPAALVLAVTASAALADQSPNLGRAATPEEISSWDIDVSPDGTGLPAGSGTAAAGATVYIQQCLACHGANGVGGSATNLAGGRGTIGVPGVRPVKTVGSFWPYATSVFAYIRRAMPYNKPKSLTSDELYAVTAYILHLNGLIGEDDVMNAATLPKVRMPNRDGFRPWARGD
jgi:S-disulfanyl-L-cysteine oxidoreductase SoxD